MINNKAIKIGLGITLVLSLSACNMMDMQRSEPMESRYEQRQPVGQHKAAAAARHKAVQKSYASKDPVQKATPGPTRKAAPQLPVIQ